MKNKIEEVSDAIKMLKSKLDGHTDTSYEWCECVRISIEALEHYKSYLYIKQDETNDYYKTIEKMLGFA